MPATPTTELTKHTHHLRKGDVSFIRDRFYPIAAATVIRKVVSQFVDNLNRPVSSKQVARLVSELESDDA